jgi:signal transduction histidine kinase
VTNDATDLETADVAKFFDRFWRRDSARAGSDHTGLGLALARAFARAHGWDLTAALASGQVTLTLTI